MLPQLKFMYSEKTNKFDEISKVYLKSLSTGKSLSEALLFAEHGGEHVVYKNYS